MNETEPNPDAWHVLPVADLIEHEDIGQDCPCGPAVEAVFP